MSTIFNSRYERTNRVRLPEGEASIDTSTPIGAAIAGSLIRMAKNMNTPEHAGNLLELNKSVKTVDGSNNKPVVIGTKETYTVTDGTNTQEVEDPTAYGAMLSNGWKLVEVKRVDIKG